MTERALVTAAEVARLAGVGRAAVSNWRRRHGDFPQPAGGTEASPLFELAEVQDWLRVQGKLGSASDIELVWHELDAGPGSTVASRLAEAGAQLAAGQAPSPLAALVAELGAAQLFERLVRRFVEAHSRQLAVTSPELAGLMVELAQVRSGPLVDPACGIGSLLHAAPADVEVRGQEIDPDLAGIADARLRFRGTAARVHVGDSLRMDALSGALAAAVVCNPPFNQRDWGFEELQYDGRWEHGLPPRGESELAWLQHCLALARPGAPVVLVMPPAVASRRAGRGIRAELLRSGALRAVIALPAGAAPPAGLSMHLWVLRRPDSHSASDQVLLVDAAAGRPDRIADVGWPLVAQRIRAARNSAEPAAGVHRHVATIDLLDDEVDLTPARHLRQATDVAGLAADQLRLRELVAGLAELVPPPLREAGTASRAAVSVGDLVRAGDLVLQQQRGAVDVRADGTGPVVLTAADVTAGRPGSGRLRTDSDLTPDAIRVEPGDVVVPLVGPGRAAVVVEAGGAVLGANLYLLRPDPARVDPWFLAGHLRSGRAASAASSASGVHRLDVRRVEVPRSPIDEQRRIGSGFRRTAEFMRALDSAAALGREVTQRWIDGVAEGLLDPDGATPPATQ